MNIQEVFIIGAKGIPAKYGGFESFVEQLTKRQVSKHIHYNVACRHDLSENKADTYEHNGATCFNVKVPNLGPAKAILYDVLAFKRVLREIKKRNIRKPIVYVLACRMGPFINYFKKSISKYDGKLFVNPDGHEWLREKWSLPVRRYWKLSEQLMVKHADLLICDSQNIEKYIKKDYAKFNPKTIYIAYGSDIVSSKLNTNSENVMNWYKSKKVVDSEYYLIVGRFVPENNYKTMINEFMNSNTSKQLVIITNVEENKFYNQLLSETNFDKDKRIKFVGTVYDAELLKYIREHAFAYIHGHEVGGTNPSLLEALGSTQLNLLLNVGFNYEVGLDGALYWDKNLGSLKELIEKCDVFESSQIHNMDIKSNHRIEDAFDWSIIEKKYEDVLEG